MKKTFKMLGAAAVLAAMIPVGAYAATAVDAPQNGTDGKADKVSVHKFAHPGFIGRDVLSQDVLNLLKLDQKTFKAKLAEGKTLAQIAEEQGVSRDALKQALTDSFNKALEEQKARFAENLDKLLDSKRPAGEFGHKIGFGFKQDISEAAKLLGISNEDLKKALISGKSLADLAKEKGVDVQKLIDLLAKPLTEKLDQQVKDGKITQEQADKGKAKVKEKITEWVNAKGILPEKRIVKKFKEGDIFHLNTEKTTQQ